MNGSSDLRFYLVCRKSDRDPDDEAISFNFPDGNVPQARINLLRIRSMVLKVIYVSGVA